MESKNRVVSQKLNIKSEKLFPKQFQFVGLLSFCTGAALFFSSPILTLFLMLIGVLLITSYRGIEFNIATKKFRAYNALLFMKFGAFESYDSVEKVYVNASNMSQKMYAYSTQSTVNKYCTYNAYLKFSNGEKLFLKSNKNKQKLMEGLREIEDLFELNIVDNTME